MTEGFDKFIRECLFLGTQIFVPDGESVTPPEIELAESNLGVNLPDSYKYFLLRCGSGMLCGEWVAHPSELYAFDADCLQMEGFVPLVHNVRGVGDYLSINPADEEAAGERPVYLCSHDPFGYVEIAVSFEEWSRKITEAQRQGVDLYASAA
jgi:SMI1 / KNR4 family (SUKH-1)